MTSPPELPQQQRRRDFTAPQLNLIRRSVARQCTDAEFDELIAVAAISGLDPLRRQIAPLIVNADDPERRRLVPWATIDGLRVIAARQGNYRPMESAPLIVQEQEKVEPDKNPLGIVRAEVRVWKYQEGGWFSVTGEAWWDEYAPLRDGWTTDENGRRQPNGKLVLDSSWARMGRVMICKCAEAQALRRGWPDLLSGLYGEEELHAVKLASATASQRLQQQYSEADRLRRASAQALWIIFDLSKGLESVAREDCFPRLRGFYECAKSIASIREFNDRNKRSLQIFWDWSPGEAWQLKHLYESRQAAMSRPRRASGQASRSPKRGRRKAEQGENGSNEAGGGDENAKASDA